MSLLIMLHQVGEVLVCPGAVGADEMNLLPLWHGGGKLIADYVWLYSFHIHFLGGHGCLSRNDSNTANPHITQPSAITLLNMYALGSIGF